MALKKLPKTVSNCGEELASVGVRLRLMLQDKGPFGTTGAPRRRGRLAECAPMRPVRPCAGAPVRTWRYPVRSAQWIPFGAHIGEYPGERFPRGAKRMCKITFTISLSVLSEIW